MTWFEYKSFQELASCQEEPWNKWNTGKIRGMDQEIAEPTEKLTAKIRKMLAKDTSIWAVSKQKHLFIIALVFQGIENGLKAATFSFPSH